MPTIQDVARAAGVSISTVSYVLSGVRPISETTRQRIFRAMESIGYRPNALARGLASRRSRIIALLLGPDERAVGSAEMEFVQGAARAARERGYHLVLWADPVEGPDDLAELGKQGLVDAVLLMEVYLHDWRIGVLASLGIPHALIGRPADAAGLNWVDIDFDLTVAGALEHLVSHGHRTVALVNQPAAMHRSGYGPAVRILDCFDLHCARLGLAGASAFCERDAPAGRDTIREVLDGWPQSTAVLVMNDQALPGVIHGIRETGRRIPEDLSLIALLCPEATARHFWPPLSAMEIPSQALGRLGMNRLIDQLEAGGSPAVAEPTLMPCTWSERGTSAPAPAIPSMPMAPHRGNTPVVRGPAKKTTGRSRGEGLGQP